MNKVFADKQSINQHMKHALLVDKEQALDIAQYWRILLRSKWIILASILISLTIGSFVVSSMTPLYRATSKILADPQPPNADRGEQYIATSLIFLYYDTQYEIIKSRNISETVVNKLNLVEEFEQTQLGSAVKLESGFGTWISNIKTTLLTFFSTKEDKKLPKLSAEERRTIIASGIQAGIEVDGGSQSKIINISYTSSNPVEAARIVNAVSEAYIQFGLETRLGEVKNTEEWLGNQLSSLKEKLRESEERLSNFRSQEGLVDTEQQRSLGNNQLQSLNSELIKAQTMLSAARERFLVVSNIEPNSKALYSIGAVLENRSASDMVKEEARLSRRVNELSERYGDKHPTMIAARSELDSARKNLAVEVAKVVESIEKDYRLAQVQVKNISNLIKTTRENIQALQSDNFSLVSLEREVENNRRIYENFQLSLMEASGRGEFTGSNVSIIDKAIVPKQPFRPRVSLLLAVAAVLGLLFGIALAFLKEVMDNTFKTPDAVEEKLGLPRLGITPVVKKKKGVVKPERQYLDDQRSPFAESINTIRTGLLFSDIDRPPKTLLVTSAMGSEGKSTMAMNLAGAFSNLGKTLLLEVDLRKPSMAKNLEIKAPKGLTDLIGGTINVDSERFYTDNEEQLTVITCGTIVRNPLELLSSFKFEALLETFKEQFEYIILDGPPTLPVSDSCILANKVDGVVFAVKAEETRIKVAKEAVSRLQKLNANILGAVLTVAEPNKMSYYGDHYYSGEYYGNELRPDQ